MADGLLTTTNNPSTLAKPKKEDVFKFDTTSKTAVTTKVDPSFAPPTPTTAETPAITPDALKPVKPVSLTQPEAPVKSNELAANLEINAQAQADAFTQQQNKAAETAQTASTNALSDYLGTLNSQKGFAELTADAMAAGADKIAPELNDINDQIRREQLSLRRAKERIQENGGGLASGAQAEINNLERNSLAKQADLAIVQMAVQGKYDSAKAIADRAVAAQLEEQTNKTEAAKFFYQENKDQFTLAEQRQFDTLLGNRERELQAESDNLKSIKDMALQAQQAGAPSDVVTKMLGAKTLAEADALGGSFLRPVASTGGIKVPTVKNFGTSDAPVWKQFNSTTGRWEDVSGVGGDATSSPEQTQKTINQLSFLRDSTKSAQDLLDNAGGINTPIGPSAINRAIGAAFKGNTSFRQMENITDSIRTNMLLLQTDPNIKKFFGPQMSEADVRMMTAAGTTLQPATQSKEQFQAELTRIDEFFNRAQTAVKNGQAGIASTGQEITGGDGQQYIIVEDNNTAQ